MLQTMMQLSLLLTQLQETVRRYLPVCPGRRPLFLKALGRKLVEFERLVNHFLTTVRTIPKRGPEKLPPVLPASDVLLDVPHRLALEILGRDAREVRAADFAQLPSIGPRD